MDLVGRSEGVEDYMEQFPANVQERMQQLRALIFELCPEAVESIAYNMPAFKFRAKPLLYFAAFEHHIGLYALPNAHNIFAHALSAYKQGKGSVQFPHKKTFPLVLIAQIIEFRKAEINKIKTNEY